MAQTTLAWRSADRLTPDPATGALVAEASDLDLYHAPAWLDLFDAAGRPTRYERIETRRDREGEITGWTYRRTAGTLPAKVVIFND